MEWSKRNGVPRNSLHINLYIIDERNDKWEKLTTTRLDQFVGKSVGVV